MTGLDWLIILAVLLSVVLAAAQGFLFEVFSLAGVIVGYLLAAWEYPRVAAWYAPYVKAPWMAEIAGFLTIFLAVILLAGIVGRVARWSAQEAGLRWADRLLGAAFGLLRGLLVATVLVMSLAAFAPGSSSLARSQFGPYLLTVGRAAAWVAPAEVRHRFQEGLKGLRDFKPGQEPPAGK
jgi:membrane protein required for colicin V production